MNNLRQRGLAAIQARQFEEACGLLTQALSEDPRDIQARAWLGQTLCSIGRLAEGHAHLRQCGQQLLDQARAAGDISGVLEIAQQMQQWRDFPGALELLGAAVQINASEFRGFQLLAAAQAQLNRKHEALSTGKQALALAPDNIMMQVLMASLEADAGLNEDARRRLDQILGGRPDSRTEFRARKELARVLDKLGYHDQIFPHLQAAARLSASLPEYSQQNLALLPDAIKTNTAGFDPELLGRWSRADFPQDQPAPVFLIGFFRSGTTLTQEVLGAHPDVLVADETDFVWAMQRELQRMDGSDASIPDKLRRLDLSGVMRLREFYWKRVQGRFGEGVGQRLFVDKFTMNTIDIGLINCIFPDAKVVFVMRDPRDVCLSCFMQLMVPSPATAHLLTWEGTAKFYAQVMAWWMHIKQHMTLDFIEFRYEDAVAQFEPTYRKVFDFLGLTWDAAVVDFHLSAAKKHIASPSRNQVAQPLYASSVARWRQFEPQFAPVAELLNPFVSAFGYEPF